jgi:hypothetical protein
MSNEKTDEQKINEAWQERAKDQLESLSRRENSNLRPCPSCGRCPTCGRGGYWTYPSYPYYPTWPPRILCSTSNDATVPHDPHCLHS